MRVRVPGLDTRPDSANFVTEPAQICVSAGGAEAGGQLLERLLLVAEEGEIGAGPMGLGVARVKGRDPRTRNSRRRVSVWAAAGNATAEARKARRRVIVSLPSRSRGTVGASPLAYKTRTSPFRAEGGRLPGDPNPGISASGRGGGRLAQARGDDGAALDRALRRHADGMGPPLGHGRAGGLRDVPLADGSLPGERPTWWASPERRACG